MDYQDYGALYPGKEFTIHDIGVDERLPYTDRQFDFSICSHVLEHMDDPCHLLWELQRISTAGYIEVPLPLADNLCSIDGDPYGHKWWIEPGYDSKIMIRKRQRVVENTLPKENYVELLPYFRSSFNAGFLWVNEIDFDFISPDAVPIYDSKLSRVSLKMVHLVESSQIWSGLRSLLRVVKR
jgi:hypothetical protein